VHTAGFDEQAGVFRIFAVWESEDDWNRFRDERLMPLIQQALESGGNHQQPTTPTGSTT
jgi:hypothetical protein